VGPLVPVTSELLGSVFKRERKKGRQSRSARVLRQVTCGTDYASTSQKQDFAPDNSNCESPKNLALDTRGCGPPGEFTRDQFAGFFFTVNPRATY
jgi:hypothetical protein